MEPGSPSAKQPKISAEQAREMLFDLDEKPELDNNYPDSDLESVSSCDEPDDSSSSDRSRSRLTVVVLLILDLELQTYVGVCLATHEPNFTIIREEFKPNQPKPCDLCGQMGHELKNCEGLAREPSADESIAMPGPETQYIFVRLSVLREYLQSELAMPNLPFKYDFERALDDWVFMCFFVGNDFLPHLPSLEIREGAIDRLVKLYKNTVYKTGGYLTDSGVVDLSRVQLVMSDLGQVEDEIFKKRRETELDFRRRDKQKKQRMRQQQNAQRPKWMMGGQFAPQAPGRGGWSGPVSNPRQAAYQGRMQNNMPGGGATAELKSLMYQGEERRGQKRPAEEQGGRGKDEDSDEEPEDNVRLWEDGWKDRYYQSKFDVNAGDIEFRHNVARHYVRGLCWVLRYYYQGCASWKWYFPYHYAPFASDFVNIGDLPNDFEKNTAPFKPLEQLMSVFPAASKKHLPITWQTLMEDPESPIIDFYPTDFKIDLNGKKYAWQGVALLPFVDEKRLRKTLETVYPDLTAHERKRNTRGNDRLFIGNHHPAYEFLEGLYEGGMTKNPVLLDPKSAEGMAGRVWCDEYNVSKGGTVPSPLPDVPDLHDNLCITVCFEDPQFDPDHLFKAVVLPGAVMPPPTLKPEDWNNRNPGQRYRPQLGFQPHSGYRNSKDMSSAHRMIMSSAGIHGQAMMPTPMRSAGLMGAGPGLMGAAPRGQGLMGSRPSSYNQEKKKHGFCPARRLSYSDLPSTQGVKSVPASSACTGHLFSAAHSSPTGGPLRPAQENRGSNTQHTSRVPGPGPLPGLGKGSQRSSSAIVPGPATLCHPVTQSPTRFKPRATQQLCPFASLSIGL
ncbi:5'-3' exoribonuclease 2 [Elysia marginata]|uniref:5'-3' exoribonuclease 2 n=1 Tax=Elysia marginata TaxID=1093978 RepID=A0AAV4ENA3_9GAST|nr:5'-3' exoribonuclease 2 [Elysia marginata]